MAPWVRTRRAHSLLKARSDEAMRVPPDQSGTAAEQDRQSIVRIAFATQRAGDIGQPVPNKKRRDALARIGGARGENAERRGCTGFIEPECRAAATIRRRLCFRPMKRRSMKSPPPFMLARKVRRMSDEMTAHVRRQPPRAHFGKRP